MRSATRGAKRKKVINATAGAAPPRKRARRHVVAAHLPKWIDQPPEDWGDGDEVADRWLLERQAEDIERDDH